MFINGVFSHSGSCCDSGYKMVCTDHISLTVADHSPPIYPLFAVGYGILKITGKERESLVSFLVSIYTALNKITDTNNYRKSGQSATRSKITTYCNITGGSKRG